MCIWVVCHCITTAFAYTSAGPLGLEQNGVFTFVITSVCTDSPLRTQPTQHMLQKHGGERPKRSRTNDQDLKNSSQNGVNGLQKVKLSTRSVSSPKSEVWERSTCSSWVKSLSRLIAHPVLDVSKKDTHIATAVNVYFRQIGKNEG